MDGDLKPEDDRLTRRKRYDLPAERRAAAEFIRRRVKAAYRHEPPASAEAEKAGETVVPISRHQQFIYDLLASGKPMRDINSAWHEYYAGLTDDEKHRVWREFNEAHAQASRYLSLTGASSAPESVAEVLSRRQARAAKNIGRQRQAPLLSRLPPEHRRPIKSALFGLGVGALTILVVMFTFFNQRFIAPFIQPSRSINTTQIITANAPVSTKPEIIIPKINVDVPVVYWVKSTEESEVQKGLENGVVHYANTAQPGQDGNTVIVGHSANNIFNKGRYKFAFSLLRRLTKGDTFYLQKGGVRYTYQVYKKAIVDPRDVSVLQPGSKPAVATLITCDPPGDNSKRLIVVGEQVSPSPGRNRPASAGTLTGAESPVLPGNSPSLWSRLINWLF